LRELIVSVASVRTETPSTRVVRVALGDASFRFKAGQAVMIGLAGSPHRVPYSIACSPGEAREGRYLEFLIKVEPSGRWGHRFERIARGQRLAVSGPFGSFLLPDRMGLRPLLFIAGGTGIAPVRAMILQALERPHGPIGVLYSARSALELAYATDLRSLARRGLLEVRFHATREAPDRWRGERSRITPAHLAPLCTPMASVRRRRSPGPGPAPLCFVCGPAAMVADVPVMLRRLGVPRRNIRLEKWSS
jgi:NAD(P)H-flavin reductase